MTATLQSTTQQLIIPLEYTGKRIDQVLAMLLPEYSRSQLTQWLNDGQITINHSSWKPKQKVKGGEQIDINIELKEKIIDQPEPIPLKIAFEDDDLIIIDKPAKLVVHPGAGNEQGTLLNALLHHQPNLNQLPRAGIIHRLDKDTSGLLIIAKTLKAHTQLIRDMQRRKISREYIAIVQGVLTGGGIIDLPIGRHSTQRTKMAVQEDGKPALTRYYIRERFRGHTYISVKLETGRTHQIRVHLAHQGHPLIGDKTYGGRIKIPAGATPALMDILHTFKRQALHAEKLTLQHPRTKETIECKSELPQDIKKLLSILRKDCKGDE